MISNFPKTTINQKDQPERVIQPAPFYLLDIEPLIHSVLMSFATLNVFRYTCLDRILWKYPNKGKENVKKKIYSRI